MDNIAIDNVDSSETNKHELTQGFEIVEPIAYRGGVRYFADSEEYSLTPEAAELGHHLTDQLPASACGGRDINGDALREGLPISLK